MSGLMAMLPGVAKIKNQLAERNLDEKLLKRQMAIINSMTPRERRNPDVSQSKPQAPHRRRLGHEARGHQPAPENAPHHGRRDEGDGRRQARPHGRDSPTCSVLAAAACRARKKWRNLRRKCRAAYRRECQVAAAGCRQIFPVSPVACQVDFPDLVRSFPAGCRRGFPVSERRNDADAAARAFFCSGFV